jgi:hypothetical protein
MAALSAARNTPKMGAGEVVLSTIELPQAVNTIFNGSLVALNAAGFVVPGSAATTQLAAGRAHLQPPNNSQVNAGAAGDLIVRIDQGVFRWDNSSAGDLIAVTEVGKKCFIVDDHTVAKTNGGATRSVAGVVMGVDASGVLVSMGLQFDYSAA